MGSPKGEKGRYSGEKRHRVKLSGGYWMMETEVTQGQFKALMGYNPSWFKRCGDNCPVERVHLYEAMAFANAVSKGEGLEACYVCRGRKKNVRCRLKRKFKGNGGKDYVKCGGWRLPTEAEWERAYRAGTKTAFYNGAITSPRGKDANLDKIGWYDENSGNKTHAVKGKQANPWGLYDMAGNVYEWVWDRYGKYPDGGLSVDPIQRGSHLDSGLSSGADRVDRGGSWGNYARWTRAAYRNWWRPTFRSSYVGFRLLRGDLNR